MNSSNYSDYYMAEIKMEQVSIFNSLSNFENGLKTLQQKRNEVIKKGFADEKEEIHFFKIIKPNILSCIFFFREIYKIERNAPLNNQILSSNYYKSCVNMYNSSFKTTFQLTDFYEYWLIGADDRDSEFFLRKKCNHKKFIQLEFCDYDPEFSTFYDQLTSYFISNNMINKFLCYKINEFDNLSYANNKNLYSLKWKRSKADLIELIYGLYHTKCFEGESINSISNLFGKFFQKELTDVYHTFHRMKYRARSKTFFINEISSALEKAMEDKD